MPAPERAGTSYYTQQQLRLMQLLLPTQWGDAVSMLVPRECLISISPSLSDFLSSAHSGLLLVHPLSEKVLATQPAHCSVQGQLSVTSLVYLVALNAAEPILPF